MMSKLFKSMQAWWPANEGEKETSKSLQLTETKVEDDTYNQEYLKALMNEQIPASLLDKMSELINSSIPEIVRQSIDKEAEKRNIYSHLLEPFTDYIKFIYSKLEKDGASKWRKDEGKFKSEILSLTEKVKEINLKKEEIQKSQLSAERQKRALNERVHELEMRITTLEAEKEQVDIEKNALLNKLKVAEVQDKDTQEECVRLKAELSGLESKITELTVQRDEISITLEQYKQKIDSLQNLSQEIENVVASKQILEKDLRQLSEENENLKYRLEEKEQIEREARERVEQVIALQEKLSETETSYQEQIEKLQEEVLDIRNANEQLGKQLADKEKLSIINQEQEVRLQQLQQTLDGVESRYQEQLTELNHNIEKILSDRDELARQIVEKDGLIAKSAEKDSLLVELNDKLAETERRYKNELDTVHEGLSNVLHAKEELTRMLGEKENQVIEFRRKEEQLSENLGNKEKEISQYFVQVESLNTELQKLSIEKENLLKRIECNEQTYKKHLDVLVQESTEKSEKNDIRINELNKELDELQQKLTEALDVAKEQERQRLLLEKEKEEHISDDREELEALKEKVKTLQDTVDEAWQYNEKLLKKIDELKDANLREKEAVAQISSGKEEELVQLKHELRVANDMLSAMKTQRQDLLDNVEKERRERANLQQYISELESTLKESEKSQKDYKLEISALEKQVKEMKQQLSNRGVGEVVQEPEEENWMRPTLPDTPDMIEKRKAEKKMKEEFVEEKTEIKPDLSQMSLW